MNYATNCVTATLFKEICNNHHIPTQDFVIPQVFADYNKVLILDRTNDAEAPLEDSYLQILQLIRWMLAFPCCPCIGMLLILSCHI